jgi:hypothetical protein
LFEAVSGGVDWANQYDLLDMLGAEAKFVYVFFILFFVIAFWNILTGHFIDSVLKMATMDWEEAMLEKRKKDHSDAQKLMRVVRSAEGGNCQSISMDDFKRLMQHDDIRSYFESRGVEISDGELLFKMLTGGTGAPLELDTFIWGCMRLKGMATSIDLHSLDFHVRLMHTNQKSLLNQNLQKMERILQCIDTGKAATKGHGRAQRQQAQIQGVSGSTNTFASAGGAPQPTSQDWAI